MLLLLLPLVTAPQAAWGATPYAGSAAVRDLPPAALRDSHEYDRFRPWKKNYFLLAWNPDLSALPSPALGGENLDLETNFQLSIRSRISDGLLIPGWTGHVGYTGTSFWQMFDGKDSSPFRTTDHAPEIFGESGLIAGHWLFRVAPYSHQSNGESGLASRSWNRSWVEAVWHSDFDRLQVTGFAHEDLKDLRGVRVALKAWKEWWLDDTNADIAEYLGYFELNADWFTGRGGDSAFSLMLRDNLRMSGDNRLTVRLEWSRAVSEEVRMVLQVYSGYGLNLLDYDRRQQSIGLGVEISP